MKTQKRYDILNELIKLNKWDINLEKGIVTTLRGTNGVYNNKRGYIFTRAYHKGKYYNFKVHQIIARAGGLNFLGLTINHKNGIKTDNRLCNLEVATYKEQMQHAVKIGLLKPNHKPKLKNRGSGNANSKLTKTNILYIRERLLNKESIKDIAKIYNVTSTHIYNISIKKRWGWLE